MAYKNVEDRKKYINEYREKHKEDLKEKKKLYTEKRKEEKKIYLKEYREKHREQLNEQQKKYDKNHRKEINKRNSQRRKVDIHFRIRQNLATRLRLAVTKKWGKTIELVGCSIPELMKHLEQQFAEGMSWENYGEWHIDHIKPCASFNLLNENEQNICFHYTNLQPLWAIDNLHKADSWDVNI